MKNLIVEKSNNLELAKLEGKSGTHHKQCLELAKLFAKDYEIKIVELYGVFISVFFVESFTSISYDTERGRYTVSKYNFENRKYNKVKTVTHISMDKGIREVYNSIVTDAKLLVGK